MSSARTVSAGIWALDVVALAMSETAAEIALLRARLAASEVRSRTAEVELAEARAVVSTSEATIAHLRLEIAKLGREQYGRNSDIDPRPGSRMC